MATTLIPRVTPDASQEVESHPPSAMVDFERSAPPVGLSDLEMPVDKLLVSGAKAGSEAEKEGPNSPSVTQYTFRSLPQEGEDSRVTGGTRSLLRRLLALNLHGSRPGNG